MNTERFDKAAANLRQTFERMGAALHPVKPTPTKPVDLMPVITALRERLPEKTTLPIQPVHAALVGRIRGEK
jgi:hypothetical protein